MKFDASGWLDQATEVDYLNKSMSRQGYKPIYIILHGTAGGTSAQGIANYFATGSDEASAHIIIDQAGNVVQGIPLSLASWANGPIDGTPASNLGFRTQSDGVHRDSWWNTNINPNYLTISIEHCKASTDNSNSLTAAQQAASFAVIKAICNAYNIPKRFADANGGISGHFSMSAINRQHCPGPYPWQELFNYLKGGTTPVANTQPTANQLQAANDAWDSVLKNTTIGPATKGTGIYQAWVADLVASSKFYGPPLTHEYNTIDWNGKAIVAQEFSRARCEWDGSPHWYGINGKI